MYFDTDRSQKEVMGLFREFYCKEPFVFVTAKDIDLKQVVQTNNCQISIQVIQGKAHIVATLDNLLKGACGQAVQNLNLMMNWPETTGLLLKSGGF